MRSPISTVTHVTGKDAYLEHCTRLSASPHPAALTFFSDPTGVLDLSDLTTQSGGIGDHVLPNSLWRPLAAALSTPLFCSLDAPPTPAPTLHSLVFDDANVDSVGELTGLDHLIRAAGSSLTTISAVNSVGVSGALLTAISSIANLPSTVLTDLDLTSSSLPSAVVEHIQLPRTLRTLDLSGNTLAPAAVSALAAALPPGTRALTLRACAVDTHGALNLARTLPRSLETLDLRENEITAAGVAGLLHRLRARYAGPPPRAPDSPTPRLAELRLGGNALQVHAHDVLQALGSLLRAAPALTLVDVGASGPWSPASPAALEAAYEELAAAAFSHSSLKVLNLRGWPLTAGAAAAWAGAAAAGAGAGAVARGCLTELDLGDEVEGPGAEQAALALRTALATHTGVRVCQAAGLDVGALVASTYAPALTARRETIDGENNNEITMQNDDSMLVVDDTVLVAEDLAPFPPLPSPSASALPPPPATASVVLGELPSPEPVANLAAALQSARAAADRAEDSERAYRQLVQEQIVGLVAVVLSARERTVVGENDEKMTQNTVITAFDDVLGYLESLKSVLGFVESENKVTEEQDSS